MANQDNHIPMTDKTLLVIQKYLDVVLINGASVPYMILNDFMSNPIAWLTGISLALFNLARFANEVKRFLEKKRKSHETEA